MRILAFHQPNFLPNLSFFYKMRRCDVFAVVTSVQYTRRDWQNRVKVSDGANEIMLVVPVTGSNRQLIREAELDPSERWRKKLVRTLQHLYGRTEERALLEAITKILYAGHRRLSDLNWQLILELRDALQLETEVVLEEDVEGRRAELVVNLCKRYCADVYLSGTGGRHYMDDDYHAELKRGGVECRFVDQNIVAEYPYSSLHYMLRDGIEAARAVVYG